MAITGLSVWKSWPEMLFFVLLVIGFIVAVSMQNASFIYIVIFIAGLFAGRYYFTKIGKQPLFPFFLILIGFLVGYMIGSFVANRKVVIFLFFLGWVISHIAHKKGYIPK